MKTLLVLEDGRIGMLDFGMVGRLDDALQIAITRLLLALSKEDSERVMDELLVLGILDTQINRQALKRDSDHMITCFVNSSVEELAASRLFKEMTGLARRHHLRLPSDLVLMIKTMSIGEGLALRLDPEFQFIPFAQPYLERFWLQKR